MDSEYVLDSHGRKITNPIIKIHPLVAFNKFVAPGMYSANWIEDSKKITDTNMSMREWAGLVLHAFNFMDLTKERFEIGKDFDDGDGIIVRVRGSRENEQLDGVFIEQTLATYKAHSDLTSAIHERIVAKSSKGPQYAFNKHLIVFCNIDGEFNVIEIEKIIQQGIFNVVNIIGFNGEYRMFMSLLFEKDKGLINRFNVLEKDIKDDTFA